MRYSHADHFASTIGLSRRMRLTSKNMTRRPMAITQMAEFAIKELMERTNAAALSEDKPSTASDCNRAARQTQYTNPQQ